MIVSWGPWTWDFDEEVKLPLKEHGSVKWGDGKIEHWVKDARLLYFREYHDRKMRRTTPAILAQRIYDAAAHLIEEIDNENRGH